MELLDMNNRWIYQGSKTSPPCETLVYWNVLSTVYPIKQEHLTLFKNDQLSRANNAAADLPGFTADLTTVGNYREV